MQVNRIYDANEKIDLLTSLILSICEENKLDKETVADNFIWELLGYGYDITKIIGDVDASE